eukprot:scaffold36507_cov60-Cyclotella_meneghiniana.AAC.2
MPILRHTSLKHHTTLTNQAAHSPDSSLTPRAPAALLFTPLGVYQASPPTMRYQPTHGQNGRRQLLLKGDGPSPLHPSLSMLPATLLQHVKAMPTATNASVPLQMTQCDCGRGIQQ